MKKCSPRPLKLKSPAELIIMDAMHSSRHPMPPPSNFVEIFTIR